MGVVLFFAFLQSHCNMYGLLTKCEVKMAGYWPGPFLRVRKKRTKPISSHLDRTNLVNKGFVIWLSGKFFMLDTAGSPERARWLHLFCSGSQSHRAIWIILPACPLARLPACPLARLPACPLGASHIIRTKYCHFFADSVK